MDWKNQFTKTPYLVLFIVLITIGVGTASALITITLDGQVNITGDADIDGSLNVDGSITGVETLEGLNCTTDQSARFDGSSWVCGKFTVKINPNTIVDSESDGFDYTSIAIGTDNNPVISYYDHANEHLEVAHCGNASCSEDNVITTVDSTDGVGEYSSIAIGSDNNPVISYYDSPNSALKVAHCGNASCSSGNTLTIVDDQAGSGKYTSIAIGLDNNPVMSYHDDVNDAIKVLHCGNPSCTSGNIKLALVQGSPDDLGKHTSIAIGTDGNPVISYMDTTNDLLKVVACGVPECDNTDPFNVITTIDNVEYVSWGGTSITIGVDDKPVISYYDHANGDLKVAHCNNTLCTTGETITTIDSMDEAGGYSSIAIGTNGNPVISYHDRTGQSLKLVQCGNHLCSAGNTISVIDSENAGEYTSIAIGTDGNPVISYQAGDDLKVVVIAPVLIFE